MRISDWSSDVCSSDLALAGLPGDCRFPDNGRRRHRLAARQACAGGAAAGAFHRCRALAQGPGHGPRAAVVKGAALVPRTAGASSEEHTSALQSLMRIPYAVICLKPQHIKHIQLKEI